MPAERFFVWSQLLRTGNNDMTQHQCASCGARFEDIDELRLHVEDEHGEESETSER